MSKIYGDLTELIGNTPLVELKNIEKQEGLGARLLAKLEYLNPAGSSSSPPAGIRASAWRRWRRRRDTGPSS